MFELTHHCSPAWTSTCALFVALSSPVIAFGQCVEPVQNTYWEYDPETTLFHLAQADTCIMRIEICFDALDPASQQLLEENGGGYVNVVFRPDESMPWEWAIQNAYESVPHQMWFELGNLAYEFGSDSWEHGVVIEAGEFGVTVLAEPAVDIPGVTEILVRPIGRQDRVLPPAPLEDVPIDPAELEPADEWDHLGPWIGPGVEPTRRARCLLPAQMVPHVSGAIGEDVPAAHARTVAYLGLLYGFPLDNTDFGDSIYGLFEGYKYSMGTESWGTMQHSAREGRRATNQSRNLPIRTGDTEWIPGEDADVEFGRLIGQAIDRLAHGHGVGLSITSRVGQSQAHPLGLTIHREMVVGIDEYPSPQNAASSLYRIKMITGASMMGNDPMNTVIEFTVDESGELCNPDGTEYGPGGLLPSGKVVYFHWDDFIPRLCDLNHDGEVDGADLAHFIGRWGTTPDGSETDGDFNGDGFINGLDLAILLGVWDWRFFTIGL